jgi:tetratricopeptide (TPR) repeat protein
MYGYSERLNRAREMEKSGNVLSALNEYRSIINDGGGREALLNLASIYMKMDRLDDALHCFEKAIPFGEDSHLFYNIGGIHYRKGRYKKAALCFEKSKRLRNDFTLAPLMMGLCFSRLKNIKAAEACFNDVLASDPVNIIALTALAIMYSETDRHEDSLKISDRIISIKPDDGKARKLRADSLYRLERIPEYAREIQSIKKSSEEFISYDRFIKSVPAVILNDRFGTIEEKIQALNEKTKEGEEPDSLISLSLCHMLKGDTDAALECLFEAKKKILN